MELVLSACCEAQMQFTAGFAPRGSLHLISSATAFYTAQLPQHVCYLLLQDKALMFLVL